MKKIPFIEFIKAICRRPSMFTTGGTLKQTLAFIDGYRYGTSTPINGRVFDRYICVRNSFPANYVWTYVINNCAVDEHDALIQLEETIIEFIQLRKTMSDDELIQYAATQRVEEHESVKVFRQFDRAQLLGDESLIRPLIEDHQDAQILWQDAYPQDVTSQLSKISASQPIRNIPVSEDGKKVKIIASGWPFPIEMNFADGQWKVNAGDIIGMRMGNKCV